MILSIQPAQNTQFQVTLPTLPEIDSPPQLFPGSFQREQLVAELIKKLSYSDWINIQGTINTGKSFVAALIESKYKNTLWISLRGESSDNMADLSNLLKGHLLRIADIQTDNDLLAKYKAGQLSFEIIIENALRKLGSESLIVIDELPDLTKATVLSQQLVKLGLAIGKMGSKLVTTSQRKIPKTLLLSMQSVEFREEEVPLLSIEDISQALNEIGIPSIGDAAKITKLIFSLTSGQPPLVLTYIKIFRKNNWVVNEDAVVSIKETASEIEEEILKKVKLFLKNSNERELLYRLSLMNTSFSDEFVEEIASIPRQINFSKEIFLELVGPWINKLKSNRFEVSQIVKQIGKRVLSSKIKIEVHKVTGRYYLYDGNINPFKAIEIFKHFIAACDWDLLAIILLRFSYQMVRDLSAKEFEPIILYLESVKDKLPSFIRLIIYAVSITVNTFLGKNTRDLINPIKDIIRIMEKAEDENKLSMLLGTQLFLIQPSNLALKAGLVAEFALKAHRNLLKLRSLRTNNLIRNSEELSTASLVWFAITHVKNFNDIREILGVIKTMTNEERLEAFSSNINYDSLQMLADLSWYLEEPKVENNCKPAFRILDEMWEVANLPGAERFKALIVRARAIIYSDYLNQKDEAIKIIENFLPTAKSEERFVLQYTAGMVFFQHKVYSEAICKFQESLEQPVNVCQFFQLDAIRKASEAAGQNDQPELMRDYAVKALKFLNENSMVQSQLWDV